MINESYKSVLNVVNYCESYSNSIIKKSKKNKDKYLALLFLFGEMHDKNKNIHEVLYNHFKNESIENKNIVKETVQNQLMSIINDDDINMVSKTFIDQYIKKIKLFYKRYNYNVVYNASIQYDMSEYLKYIIAKNTFFAIRDGKYKVKLKQQVLGVISSIKSKIIKDFMQLNGISKFKWIYTYRSIKQREVHVNILNNGIYDINNPPVIDNDGTTGIPGQLINCKCAMEPMIDGKL